MKKQPIDVSEISGGDERISISEACMEYMKVEYGETLQQTETRLNQHPQQRLRSGKAVVIKVVDVTVSNSDSDDEVTITGRVDYSNFPYDKPGEVLSGLRLKEGDFVKGIELKRNLDIKDNISTSDFKNIPSLVIENIDINETSSEKKPTTGEITLNGRPMWGKKSEFKVPNRINDETLGVHVGDVYMLDSRVTNYTFDSAHYALQNPEYSDMHSLIEKLIDGYEDNSSKLFNRKRIENFTDWMKDKESDVLPVNEKQEEFITDCEHEISLLQGPPGTGKTSGAVAPSIISRVLSKQNNGACRVLVTGTSHKSINEVMKETVELATKYVESDNTDTALDNTEFAHLVEPAKSQDDVIVDTTNKPFTIRNTRFYGDEVQAEHKPVIEERLQTPEINGEDENIIIFATPRRAWRLAKTIIPNFALKSSETLPTGVVEGDRPHRGSTNNYGLFDVLVADEASMMTMPSFMLTGTFYEEGGNILISGDHRQLPPVQQYSWDEDYRPAVTEVAPFASVLNFFRIIRGEEIDTIDDDVTDLLRIHNAPVDIPLHSLTTTYRCHEDVAEFLEKWVYNKLDGIEYNSTRTETMTKTDSANAHVNEILKPDSPITVVTYDEQSNQQSNELEAEIIREVLHGIPNTYTSGVVAPHNAQRGLIETKIGSDDTLGGDSDVDTVERFQGGERDVIVMSGTVSDPDYIEQEEKFLLSLNRLNVAMSRMKKKLVVVASESIFNHIPVDTNDYENTLLWKGLAKESGMNTGNGVKTQPSDLLSYTEYLSDEELNATISINHLNE